MDKGTQCSIDSFDDTPPDRANEERASRRILLLIVGAAMTVTALYGLAVLCGVLARSA